MYKTAGLNPRNAKGGVIWYKLFFFMNRRFKFSIYIKRRSLPSQKPHITSIPHSQSTILEASKISQISCIKSTSNHNVDLYPTPTPPLPPLPSSPRYRNSSFPLPLPCILHALLPATNLLTSERAALGVS